MNGPTLQVVCAWCKADLGRKQCVPAAADSVSHGICPSCRAQFLSNAERRDGGGTSHAVETQRTQAGPARARSLNELEGVKPWSLATARFDSFALRLKVLFLAVGNLRPAREPAGLFSHMPPQGGAGGLLVRARAFFISLCR